MLVMMTESLMPPAAGLREEMMAQLEVAAVEPPVVDAAIGFRRETITACPQSLPEHLESNAGSLCTPG